jgi:hypothetical protein
MRALLLSVVLFSQVAAVDPAVYAKAEKALLAGKCGEAVKALTDGGEKELARQVAVNCILSDKKAAPPPTYTPIPPPTPPTLGGGNSLSVTCFKRGEYVSGFNKVCSYDCLGSMAATTISSTALCPLTMKNR